jgi:hypothetical protein
MSPRARRRGLYAHGPIALGPPAPEDHRSLAVRGPADARPGARSHGRLQRLHLQLPPAAGAADGRRLPLLLDLGHRGGAEGLPRLRRRLRRAAAGHVRLRRSTSATRAARCSAGTGSASSPSTSPRPRGGCGSPRACPALLAGGGIDTSIDPVALHHYLTFHSVVPAPRTILPGCASCPRPPRWRSSPTAGAARWSTGGRTSPGTPTGPTGRRGLGGRGPRRAAHRGGAPPGRRRAGGRPAVRRPRLLAGRRPARRGGPARPADLLHRLRGRRGRGR